MLAIAPIMGTRCIDAGSVIVDSKCGLSVAGSSPVQSLMFSEANESVKAYAITTHRHTPEIEQELSQLLGTKKKIKIIFTPHLIPMDRGILSTIYVRLKKKVSQSYIHKIYQDFYSKEPFVRILGKGVYPNTKDVKGSNYCDVSVFVNKCNPKIQSLIIVSVLDNLLKGASGQAVHNMNIMYGFDETAGLSAEPAFP